MPLFFKTFQTQRPAIPDRTAAPGGSGLAVRRGRFPTVIFQSFIITDINGLCNRRLTSPHQRIFLG